ncbi:hypothetical protein Hdeb2414_s0002g00055291 [Helianthus debilis subsp. tardiflorus]
MTKRISLLALNKLGEAWGESGSNESSIDQCILGVFKIQWTNKNIGCY